MIYTFSSYFQCCMCIERNRVFLFSLDRSMLLGIRRNYHFWLHCVYHFSFQLGLFKLVFVFRLFKLNEFFVFCSKINLEIKSWRFYWCLMRISIQISVIFCHFCVVILSHFWRNICENIDFSFGIIHSMKQIRFLLTSVNL